MIRFLTAGESHGKGLTTIVEGFPSNIPLDTKYINKQLVRRMQGYGRGMRMKIEVDTVNINAGVRFKKTLGSPISLYIENRDWKNWTDKMDPDLNRDGVEKITIPRPGHADMVGVTKYNFDDIRNSIERSSARETAARVAAGTVARRFLEEFNIHIGSYIESIGNIYSDKKYSQKLFENDLPKNFNAWKLALQADGSKVRVLDDEQEKKIIRKIQIAKKKGDTLGGTFFTVATGVPVGLGSFVHYDTKLSADIAQAVMSINAVKAVEIGTGFDAGEAWGSISHDEIIIKRGIISRKSNRAGGIEGGISTGLPIIVRAAMKPIATLMSPIRAIDLKNMKPLVSRRERSDFVAAPACAVISESMLAWVISKHFLQKFGGDSLEETKNNYNAYTKNITSRVKQNFKNKL